MARSELWARFDAAVERLNQAGAGDSLADLVAAYAAVAEAAGALADALEAAGRMTAPRNAPAAGRMGATAPIQLTRR